MLRSSALAVIGLIDHDEWVLLGFGLLFAVLFGAIFFGAWKAYSRTGFCYFLLFLLCIPAGVAFAVKSTLPSSAERRDVAGRLDWTQVHHQGRSTSVTFGIVLDDGRPMAFDGEAYPPGSARGFPVLVTYLDEKVAGRYPRAIGAQVLAGPDEGWHNTVSADWLGPWLGVPGALGVAIWMRILADRNRRVPR